jgi:dephospho-CoA kinase
MLIAVTGGVGSGKSRVASLLGKLLDGIVINTDEVCRDLLEPGCQGYVQFVASGGERFLDKDHTIDRVTLRKELFEDACLREKLESILHPLVFSFINTIVADNPHSIVIAEVPLLYETNTQDQFDTVISVYAPEEKLIDRVVQRDKATPAETRQILTAQMSMEEKNRRADHIVRNDGDWQDTQRQVADLALILQKKY